MRDKGTEIVPLNFVKQTGFQDMINREDMKKCTEQVLAGTGRLFLVDIEISKDNNIDITIESDKDSVTIDDCIWLSGVIGERFDRDVEDYELTVGSAGLDSPFKVPGQYAKAVGSMVEVKLKGGKKITGKLLQADEDGITLDYERLESAEGKKRKIRTEVTEKFGFETVNSVKYHISFE